MSKLFKRTRPAPPETAEYVFGVRKSSLNLWKALIQQLIRGEGLCSAQDEDSYQSLMHCPSLDMQATGWAFSSLEPILMFESIDESEARIALERAARKDIIFKDIEVLERIIAAIETMQLTYSSTRALFKQLKKQVDFPQPVAT